MINIITYSIDIHLTKTSPFIIVPTIYAFLPTRLKYAKIKYLTLLLYKVFIP